MVDVTRDEYLRACSVILENTLNFIDPKQFTGFDGLTSDGSVEDMVANSAVTDNAGITIVQMPSGTSKSTLLRSRVNALMAAGIEPQDILVLNMNIAKTNDIKQQIPNVNALTFNEFISGLFTESFPGIEPSNEQSVIDLLRLHQTLNDNEQKKRVVNMLENITNRNAYSRNIMMALWVNRNINLTMKLLYSIQKADSRLQALVCHNKSDDLRDPYGAKVIIANGVQNMPLPAFCTMLIYAQKHHCNLFLTCSPDETVYEFSFAYGDAVNLLSSKVHNLHIIRVTNTPALSESIAALAELKTHHQPGTNGIEHEVLTESTETPALDTITQQLIAPNSYLRRKLDAREQILVIANRKHDLDVIKQTILDMTAQDYPDLTVSDLTRNQTPPAVYGRCLVKYAQGLREKYPDGISMRELFMELYNAVAEEAASDNPSKAAQYAVYRDELFQWATDRVAQFNGFDAKYEVFDGISRIIDIESEDIQNHIAETQNDPEFGSAKGDIVFSTIHSAIDIRKPNAIIVIRSNNDIPDLALRRVAISRASKTELLYFINEKPIRDPYQDYLKYVVT